LSKANRAGMELPVESVVAGRYKVMRLLARGGMAEVYVAKHIKLNREIALKLLKPPPDAEDPESFEKRFQLEAEVLASLDHANIVTLHDFGDTDDGRFFLAMEFIDGPRLSDVLKAGPLPYQRAVRLLLQVCAALRYAHKRGVIHRDLKPSNLLVKNTEEGEENEHMKVVDFGLVKLTEGDQSITRAGLILGSPHCMAPEQVKGTDVDHTADIYALGVLLFRSITGHYPFHGSTSTATMIAHLNQPIPTFDSVAPHIGVPNGLEDIVRKCLAKAPKDRYPDMEALMWDLATCVNLPADQFGSLSLTHSSIQRRVAPDNGTAPASGSSAGMGLAIAAVAGIAVLIGVTFLGGGLLIASQSGGDDQTAARPAPPNVESTIATIPVPELITTEVETPPSTEEGTDADPEVVEPEVPVEPVVEPVKVVKPPTVKKKVVKPTPPPVADKPDEPEKPAEEEKKDDEKAPDGYMGLPDDLF